MGNKSLEEMSDDELLQLHAQEVGLDNLSDDQLMRLTELEGSQPQQEETDGLGKAFVKSLPMAGGVIGGGLGGLAGGIGAVPGSMWGAAAGKALQTGIEGTFFKEPKSRAEIYGGPAVEAVSAGLGEVVSPYITKGLVKGAEKLMSVPKALSSSLSKIPERSMEVFYERPQAVSQVGKQYGISAVADDTQLAEAANAYRTQLQKQIENFKSAQNAKITSAIEKKGDQLVDISKTISAVENNINKLDPILDAEKIDILNLELDKIKSMTNSQNQVTSAQAYRIGNKFQELADYKQLSNPLAKKDFVDLTFAKGASEARQALKSVVPEISNANAQLAQIRRMNKTLNKNLITPDKPYQSLIGVGTGENQINRLQMKKLGDIIGQDLISTPENIAAASYFENAGILPKEKTGSSLTPLILGGAGASGPLLSNIKQLAQGNLEALGGVAGGAAMGAMASPIAIKGTIKTAAAIRSVSPDWSKQMIEQIIQGAIQQGITPTMMDAFVKKSDLKNYEKAITRKQITEGQ